jgi:hypothetical protein
VWYGLLTPRYMDNKCNKYNLRQTLQNTLNENISFGQQTSLQTLNANFTGDGRGTFLIRPEILYIRCMKRPVMPCKIQLHWTHNAGLVCINSTCLSATRQIRCLVTETLYKHVSPNWPESTLTFRFITVTIWKNLWHKPPLCYSDIQNMDSKNCKLGSHF